MKLREFYAKLERGTDVVLEAVGAGILWLVSSPWTAGITLAVVVVAIVATCSVAR